MASTPFSNGEPRARVLLTGFGPFPTVPDNASARLVFALAPRARERFPQCDIAYEVLPTEWALAPERLNIALRRLKPDVILSFGVARGAEGFRIEARSLNVCRPAADAAGRYPVASVLRPDGVAEIASAAPIDAIAARLRAFGYPVSISEDAGGYLCNAAYYEALSGAADCGSAAQIVFVHVPHDLTSGPLTHDRAIEGALEILAACLERRLAEI